MKLTRYVSEYEQFLDGYMAEHPAVVEDQRRGWRIWWDRIVDLDALKRQARDSVPPKPYYYS